MVVVVGVECIFGAWETWDENVLVHHMLHYEIHLWMALGSGPEALRIPGNSN
jgi:hypothetical protein